VRRGFNNFIAPLCEERGWVEAKKNENGKLLQHIINNQGKYGSGS